MYVQRVALVRHELLQHPERGRLALQRPVLEPRADRRRMGERRPLRQKPPDLEIGVLAGLHAPEPLQDRAVAVEHRGIALLGLAHGRRRQRRLARHAPQRGRGRADDLARAPAKPGPPRDRIEQRRAERRVDERVVQDARLGVSAGPHRCQRRAGRVPQDLRRAVAGRERERQHVRLRVTVDVPHLQQRHVGGRGRVRDPDRLPEMDRPHRARLAAEPAPSAEIAAQHLLERRTQRRLEHSRPSRRPRHDELAEARVASAGRGRRGLRPQREPVERVRPEA